MAEILYWSVLGCANDRASKLCSTKDSQVQTVCRTRRQVEEVLWRDTSVMGV